MQRTDLLPAEANPFPSNFRHQVENSSFCFRSPLGREWSGRRARHYIPIAANITQDTGERKEIHG
jgi:U3 small nucleolar RNA-associated protein 14